MKAFVITITSLDKSVEIAERCINSAKDRANLDVEIFDAITPKKGPWEIAKKLQLNTEGFKHDVGSRPDNVLSTFLSHYRLWAQCAKGKEEFLIFEHDAVVVNDIPRFMMYDGMVSLGAPSYGKFVQPLQMGVIPLTSKRYLPGAHAYRLKPKAAQVLCDRATNYAGATDVFLNVDFFPWLQEYYPWPVVVKDTFTTIQNVTGCQAKHNYNENYEIVKI